MARGRRPHIFVKRKQPAVWQVFAEDEALEVFPGGDAEQGANWRKMAEDARAMADRIHDPAAKQAMQEIAARYEVLAAYSERQAKKEAERCSPSSGR